jgi:hypothetical protein
MTNGDWLLIGMGLPLGLIVGIAVVKFEDWKDFDAR